MLRWQARGGLPADAGRVTRAEVPATALAQRARASRSPLAPGAKQILFGDLHVHTQFSSDARVFGLPLFEGEGAHPPADACDFARFCSALDFWSINDHAEQMLPEQWRETRASIRACNEAAGDPADPETVAFLGWEWSQTGLSASTHYGHRNVVLRDTDDEATPTRPIAAGRWNAWAWIGALHAQADPRPEADYRSYRRYLWEGLTADRCPDGVPVRELPADCLEVAETPDRLFEKLDAWGMPSLVIPHGLSWGTTNPPGATLDHQLGAMHDPSRQRLLEVYSGHGSSELWRDLRHFEMDAAGEPTCPAPGADFTPCCWRAGQIVRERCDEPRSDRCEREVEAARAAAFGRFLYGDIGTTLEGASPEDWLDCGQLRGAFLPAFGYRPQQSAQYALALTGEDEGDRFRFGLIGSSDNHRARPGTGYKEFGLGAMTDGNRPVPGWARDESGWRARLIRTLSAPGRNDAFYYTGGLVAVHAPDRSRESIFAALERREVYGTSGPRIQLWFDLLGASGARHPMGSELRGAGPLRFEVRAAGAHVERPGCPSHVETRLGPERLASLCLGECHFPGDTRHPIDRIEIVRIRPGRALPEAIQDPWRSFPCRGEGEGCRVAFEDPDPPAGEVLYYARALQAPTEAVGGDPLSCERDEAGRCVRAELCVSAGYDQPVPEACRAPVQERAWSSPIFVSVDAGGS
ncbi:MAG: hypothetical protein CL910_16615 [Deltaproteobacteria bacterium]|nr:hypothetical protein [Deltaproteobacteria bacterium]